MSVMGHSAQEHRLKDHIKIGTWSHDLERNVVRCCGVTASLFGFTSEESASEVPIARFVQAIHSKDRKRFSQAIREASRQGGDFQVEYRIRSSSGELRRVLDRGEFYANADGVVERARGIVVDLTGHVPAPLKLRRANSSRGLACSVASLPHMADHLVAAWNIGQQLPPSMFASLRPAFRNLLIELGRTVADAALKHHPVSGSTVRPH